MGVYIADKTYKEILSILAQTGERIDTRNITEIDLVMCGECKYYEPSKFFEGDMVCMYRLFEAFYTESDRYCSYGERRADV